MDTMEYDNEVSTLNTELEKAKIELEEIKTVCKKLLAEFNDRKMLIRTPIGYHKYFQEIEILIK